MMQQCLASCRGLEVVYCAGLRWVPSVTLKAHELCLGRQMFYGQLRSQSVPLERQQISFPQVSAARTMCAGC